MNRFQKKWIIGLFLIALSAGAWAQKTNIYTSDFLEYQKGLELLDQKKYVAAQQHFTAVMRNADDPNGETVVNSEYYAAYCALELFNRDAEYRLSEFVRNHPESPLVRLAYFQLGKYNYRKKKWPKVIAWMDKVDMYDLTPDELSEYHFSIGYSYFMMGEYDKAQDAFYEIKDVDTPFTPPAKYYYSHIAYVQGNYETALIGFEALTKHKKFAAIVPYYITQIYYHQNKNEELLAYAPGVLENARPKRKGEISGLIGQAYFRTERYEESIPYLEKFKSSGSKMTSENKYQLGYAYFKSGNYNEAIEIFNTFTKSDSQLAQICYDHLAECYLETGNKQYARNAFFSASKFDDDPAIKENALFNFAKLSYELSFDPYASAIGAFEDYVKLYPNSERKEEAYGFMLDTYLNAKNYRAALKSLESFDELDLTLQEAYQQVSFNLAVEQFLNGKYADAIDYFAKARKYTFDQKVSTQSWYWTAESQYQLRDFESAAKSYKTFIFEPGAILMDEYHTAHYNLGYCYFEQKKYDEAVTWFRKYAYKKEVKDQTRINDALLRIADAYYIREMYFEADPFYEQAAEVGKANADYALYQRAVVLGLLKNRTEKVDLLEKLLRKYKDSDYADDSKFQLGREYVALRKNEEALELFDEIIEEGGNYTKRALLEKGIVLRNTGKNVEAWDIFVRITEDYPTYKDSKEALGMLKLLAIELNRVEAWENLMQPWGELSKSHVDSTRFEAVQMLYFNGECEVAQPSFMKYLQDFEQPIFQTDAHFYMAECAFDKGNYEEALEHYNAVISVPNNDFMESALAKAADIAFNLDQHQEALGHYISLEKVAAISTNKTNAQIGQMRLFYLFENWPSALMYAESVMANASTTEKVKLEAKFISAKSNLMLGNEARAIKALREVADQTQTEFGSEAQYLIAKKTYEANDPDKATQQIKALVQRKPSYADWVARGLILLSDITTDAGDTFQSKATLQSILENYQGEQDIIDEAQSKLDAILAAEKAAEEAESSEEIEIMFDGVPESDVDTLFEEEPVEPITDEDLKFE